MQNKLKFPTFDYIKSLPLTDGKDRYGGDVIKEYYFTLFEVYGSIYCRFTYNEDGNERFYLDLMQDGYSDHSGYSSPKSIYECTESDYKLLCEHAQMLYDEILGNLLNSNNECSERWIEENE